MKFLISHLPEKKQHEILHIVGIIKEVVRPEMIILFGSHAKGTYVEDSYKGSDGIIYEYISDYDFLVVTKNNSEKTYVQESTILDRVDRYKPPVNLEIHDIGYINEGLSWGQYFFSDIINEGILLYDTKSVEFIKPKVLTPVEERQKALDYFNTWYSQSAEFIIDSKNALSRESLHVGSFYLHQAVENLYYTTLLVFTGYKPKIHNLWRLRKKIKSYSEDLFNVFAVENNSLDDKLFDLLKRSYIEARYKKHEFSITGEELTILIRKVEEMNQIVNEICNKRINQI